MAEPADVTINGELFMLAAYERSAEAPAPSKPGRLSLSTFNLGLGWTEDTTIPAGLGGGGWSGSQVHSVAGGSGLEPWPRITTQTETLQSAPLKTQRTVGIVAANRVYLNIDRRLYTTVLLSATSWSALTLATSLAAPNIITDLAYHRDDILHCSGPASNILRWNTATSAGATWRAGEEGTIMQGAGAAVMYAPLDPNEAERFNIGLTQNNGTAVTRQKWVDAPIVRMGLFNGQLVVATKLSLFLLDGVPFTATTTTADVEWQGEPRPLLGHGTGITDAAGDFVFLLSFLGRLYTWLAGSVVAYDPSVEGRQWRQTGPEGIACYGACVAAGYLVVALETAAGRSQVWASDGAGWWLIADALASSTTSIWPVALHGAGAYDALWFTHGSTAGYQLARLTPKAAQPTYPTSGTWTSPLLTAGNADATKAWRRIAAYFAWPEPPGAAGSGDSVTLTLEYSTDAGESWTVADSESVAIANQHQLSLTLGGPGGTPPPTSRLLQLRVSWASVSDWAPILTRLVVDYAIIDTSPKRRVWKLKVAVRDRNVRRDSGVLPLDARQQIDALWEAWRDETTLSFRDVDYDVHPTPVTVRVLDISEAAPRPGDAGRWGDGTVTVTLGEV